MDPAYLFKVSCFGGHLQNRWITGQIGNVDANLRLFCFAHAGSGGTFYYPWKNALLPEIEVCPVVLPGRETRLSEEPYTRVEQLIEPLFSALLPLTGKPFALFGHSVGAIVAYELARRLTASYVPAPLALLVSGRRAPHFAARRQPVHGLSDRDFLAAVTRMNGMRTELLEYPELLQLFLPALRADFAINDTYAWQPQGRLSCPVFGFAGEQDAEVHPSEMSGWADVTSGAFTLRVFPGDHFYLKDAPSFLLSAIRQSLTAKALQLP